MKTFALLLLGTFIPTCFAQNNLSSFFTFGDRQVNTSSCYSSTPLVPTPVKKDQVLFQSTDGGTTWNDIGGGLPENIEVSRCIPLNEGTFVGSFDGKVYYNANLPNSSWELQQFDGKKSKGFCTGIFPGKFGNYATFYQDGLYKQIPGTHIWKPIHANLDTKEIFAVIELEDGSVMVGGTNGIFHSYNEGKTWKHIFIDSWVNSLVQQSNVILTNAPKGLYRSGDYGKTWNCVVPEAGGMHKTLCIDGYFVNIHGGGNLVSISADGITWKPMDPGKPADLTIFDINKSGEYLFSSRKAGISRSNDMGKTWQLVLSLPAELEQNGMFCEIISSNSQLFALVKQGC